VTDGVLVHDETMRGKCVDMENMIVIHRGVVWQHDSPPSCKKMALHLEGNEGLVTWVQPKDGTVADQIPCIQCAGGMYALSLRMQKAIWRHVRLKRGYVNMEPVSQGGFKLKIPRDLLNEKIRTQTRFNVRDM